MKKLDILPLYDTSFKYLFKNKSVNLLKGLVKYISGIDITNYYLYDNEINSGNNSKDMRMDIILVENPNKPYDGDCINIELYKNYHENTDLLKSKYYLYTLIAQRLKSGDSYKKTMVYQINLNDGYSPYNKNTKILCLYETDSENNIRSILYKIYNVYLSNYMGICYNGENKYEALLSLIRCNNYNDMLRIANNCEEMVMLINELEELKTNDELFGVYNYEVMQRKLRNTDREFGRKEGFEKGIAKGMKKGIESEKNKICINLLNKNFSVNLICDCLDMKEDEVIKIKQSIV